MINCVATLTLVIIFYSSNYQVEEHYTACKHNLYLDEVMLHSTIPSCIQLILLNIDLFPIGVLSPVAVQTVSPLLMILVEHFLHPTTSASLLSALTYPIHKGKEGMWPPFSCHIDNGLGNFSAQSLSSFLQET